jgi:hypothetical protein
VREKVAEVIAIVSEITHLDPTYSGIVQRLEDQRRGSVALADHVAASFHFSLGQAGVSVLLALDERYDIFTAQQQVNLPQPF